MIGGDTPIRDLFGNTLGLKQGQIHRLLATYRRRVPPTDLVSPELARHLTEIAAELNRQVGVLLSRKGEVERVIVGDASRLWLPDVGRARAGQARLRGLRLVHTHLKSEPLSRDDLTDLALLRLDLVAAIGVSERGLPGVVHWAHLLPENPAQSLWLVETAPSLAAAPGDLMARVAALEVELADAARARPVNGAARAVLVTAASSRAEVERSMEELRELARTAGVEVSGEIAQVRPHVDPRYLVGKGKLQDIVLRSMQSFSDTLVFGRELSPVQAAAIAEETSLKILDRTQLILDIFAQRAASRDGKLQVELAQLRYRLPRLAGRGDSLSRLMGGIGGRGPGETKLEIDRRRARDRIARLEREIDSLSRVRAVRRSRRERKRMPAVALVGYTNAGKSTLLEALTYAETFTCDALFATLDPLSRRIKFPVDREVVLTDTVGFLRDLPRDLVAAFRATLEELGEADLLILVVDGSDPDCEGKLAAVEGTLASLDLAATPRVIAVNKCDRLPPGEGERLAGRLGGVAISAAEREGLDALLGHVERGLFQPGAAAPRVDALPEPEEATRAAV